MVRKHAQVIDPVLEVRTLLETRQRIPLAETTALLSCIRQRVKGESAA